MNNKCLPCAARNALYCGYLDITLSKEKDSDKLAAPCENTAVHKPIKSKK